MIDGEMYVNAIDDMIIEENVWHSVDEIEPYKSCKKCKCWITHFDSMNVTNSTVTTGNTTVLSVDVVLKWYYHRRECYISGDDIRCYDLYKNTTETATFTAAAERPTYIDRPTINCTVHITFYNDSRNPVTFIRTSPPPHSIVKTTYTYNGSTAEKYIFGVFRNDYIEFFSDMPVWRITKKQSELSRRGDLVLVRGRFDKNKLNISMSTPYHKYYIDDCTMDTITPNPPRIGILVSMLLILCSSVLVIITIVGVLRRG